MCQVRDELHIGDAFALDGAGDDALRLVRASRAAAAAAAARIASGSCPSISVTSQPKASKRPPIGSTDIVSSVVPSSPIWLASTIATTLPRPKWEAEPAASQTWPSFSSWSPSSTQIRRLVVAAQARRLRHPDPDREAVAEAAGGEVDAGDAAHVGVVAERAAEPRVGVEPVGGEVAAFGEQRVEADRDVALGEDQPVALGPLRVLGDPHHAGVQGAHQLGAGEDAGVVAAAGDPDQADRLAAHQRGAVADFLDLRADAVRSCWSRSARHLFLSVVVLFPLRHLYRRRGAILYVRLK